MREFSTGTIGGRYALAAEIASGGMATVHIARQLGDAGFARTVAVKRLHERYARDPEFVAMFLDEARLVSRIRHTNVVQTLDVVAEADPVAGAELFIVMEYVHGESLVRLLMAAMKKGGGLPIRIAASIASGMLWGLHEAHEARSEAGEPLGIVHRDVSPHNVLVGIDGVARVLDFGVAKATERITTTSEGQLKGKVSYMAPEQVKGRPVDRRTDIYAAAVVLWETLTGSKLFFGETEAAVLHQIVTTPPRPPSVLNREIPPALEAVVMRGLAHEPEARFATAREMALVLESTIAPASAAEVGAWVQATCSEAIEARWRLVAEIEARTSSANLRHVAAGMRSLASTDASRTPAVQPLAQAASRAGAPPSGSARIVGLFVAAIVIVCALGSGAFVFVVRRTEAREKGAPSTSTAAASASVPLVFGSGRSVIASASSAPDIACPDGMVPVPGGKFFMGSDEDLPAERPAHNVTIRALCMDRFEVSAAAYRTCSDRGDCKRASATNKWDGMTAKDQKIYDPLCNAAAPDRGKHPINCVDWSMADRFCKASGKRLPTEAEWEFAARGSDGRKYPWGDDPPTAIHLNACGAECGAWLKKHGATNDGLLFPTDDGWPTTAPVGSFPVGASRWGLYDVVGNVWEWVADFYAPYTEGDQVDPVGPGAADSRVIRGGAWNGAYTDWVRPTFRFHSAPETRSHGIGFRCAKSL